MHLDAFDQRLPVERGGVYSPRSHRSAPRQHLNTADPEIGNNGKKDLLGKVSVWVQHCQEALRAGHGYGAGGLAQRQASTSADKVTDPKNALQDRVPPELVSLEEGIRQGANRMINPLIIHVGVEFGHETAGPRR